jgi:hypothetical protein
MDQDEKAQLVKFFSSFRTKPSITLKVWITLKHFVLSTDSAPGAGFHLPKPRPYFFCRCNWRRRLQVSSADLAVYLAADPTFDADCGLLC